MDVLPIRDITTKHSPPAVLAQNDKLREMHDQCQQSFTHPKLCNSYCVYFVATNLKGTLFLRAFFLQDVLVQYSDMLCS